MPIALLKDFQSHNFGTSRKPICDFLLVSNTDLHPVLHDFEVIADYWSNFCCRQGEWILLILITLIRSEPQNSGLRNLALIN